MEIYYMFILKHWRLRNSYTFSKTGLGLQDILSLPLNIKSSVTGQEIQLMMNCSKLNFI